MLYTLGQSAKAVGKAKGTIKNAIDKGRLSASKNDKGQYQIDPAELHRVYPLPTEQGNLNAIIPSDTPPSNDIEIKLLEAELKHRDEKIRMLEEDRDEWRKQAQSLLLSPPNSNTSLWRKIFKR